MDNIVIATIKEWNIENYFHMKEKYSLHYNFHLITDKDELTINYISEIKPKYIFFPHWSWIIPKVLYENFECVVFHMTDLPFGRGGSPLQNLIVREIYDTKISALRVDNGLDTGAIYLKEDFNIAVGSAEENFIKLSGIIFSNMIPKFLNSTLMPVKQSGESTIFQRRKPHESDMHGIEEVSITKVYDFVRMLDAEGYPKAYIKLNNLKIEFSEVHMKNKKLVGRFEVLENE